MGLSTRGEGFQVFLYVVTVRGFKRLGFTSKLNRIICELGKKTARE